MEITLQGKTYTIDDAEALQQAITDLEVSASTHQAENQGLKTKIDELQEQLESKNDSESIDFDSLVGERLQIWSEVLPHLRHDNEDFQPDYNLSPLQVKVVYLNNLKHDADWKQGLQERKDELLSDSPSPTTIAYVNGLYGALKPSSSAYKPTNHCDSVLESIMFGKHQTSLHTDSEEITGKTTKIDHRANLQKKLEAKNPLRKGRQAS